MSKIIIEEDSPLNGIEIQYPFCYKTKKNTYGEINYYRFLEDGRYEHICLQELQMHLSFGNHANTIYSLLGDFEFYFKQIALRNTIITEGEFELQRDEYYKRYNEYLEGSRYIAQEVESLTNNQYEEAPKNTGE